MKNVFYIKRYFLKKVTFVFLLAVPVLVLMCVGNTFTDRPLFDLLELMNHTLEKDLIFFPLAVGIMCNLFDRRTVYVLRFREKSAWMRHEMTGVLVCLFLFTVLYQVVLLVSNLVTVAVTAGELSAVDPALLQAFGLFLARRYLYVTLLAVITFSLSLIWRAKFHLVGFFVYLVTEVFQILEIAGQQYADTCWIRPNVILNHSLIFNVFMTLPTVFAIFFFISMNSYLLNKEGKQNA